MVRLGSWSRVIDEGTRLHSTDTITVTTTGTQSVAIELGGETDGWWIIDASAVAVTGAENEVYQLRLYGSTDNFATHTVMLAECTLGDKDAIAGTTYDRGAGVYAVPFSAMFYNSAGELVPAQQVKLGYVISGTTPSITMKCTLSN